MDYKFTILLLNVLFPPLAVLLQRGFGPETLLNALLYVMAIIPAYLHGFWITYRTFHHGELTERHQWVGVHLDEEERKRRQRRRDRERERELERERALDRKLEWEREQERQWRRSRSPSRASSVSYGSEKPIYGVLEEYSDTASSDRHYADHYRRLQNRIDTRTLRRISDAPPPCPPSPPAAYDQRYLQ